MKKKLLWCAGIAVLIALIILGVWRYVEVRQRQTDPNLKLAEQIYKMENALREVDEDYACKSLSKVTPFTYTDSAGNIITYYCCQTTYLSDKPGDGPAETKRIWTVIAVIVAGTILLQLLAFGMIVLFRAVTQNGQTEIVEWTEIIEK